MARIGTFGSFTQARLAIYASQAGMQVTGNNIANINTKGYTRQKL
jgi:flagellar hook-associated protein 1 FlgK